MGNSAFNQGQTGNATEIAGGVVEEATAAEVAAKTDVGGSGAKLFVPPSKLPSGGDIASFIAYENIAEGDAVGISHYYPQSGIPWYAFTAYDSYYTDLSNTTWYAIKFRTPVLDGDPYIQLQGIYGPNLYNSDNDAEYFRVRIRETLTGPDIITSTESGNDAGGYYTMTFRITSSMASLSPDTEYYFICEHISGAGDGMQWRYDSTQADIPEGVTDPVVYKTIDSGASWNPIAGISTAFRITTQASTSLGHRKIFKANAASVNNARFGFFGYAKEAATIGNPVTVVRARKTDLHSGLTVGRKYYLQDTDGQIGITPGAIPIELGIAVSDTEIYRDINQSEHFVIASNSLIQFDGIAGQNNAGSPSMYLRAYDRINFESGATQFSVYKQYMSEGGVGGVRFSPGCRLDTNTTTNACMIYPQG